jgi:hypothetical protein
VKHLFLTIFISIFLLAFGSVALAQDGGQTYLPIITHQNGNATPTAPATETPVATDTPIPTATPVPTETPDPGYTPGEYEGTKSVAFTATEDGEVCSFNIKITTGIATCHIHPPECAPIIDSQFVFTSSIPGATYGITGTWSTSTTVEGIHSNLIWCGNSFMLFGGMQRWSASKIE